jgi:hypothetical protein
MKRTGALFHTIVVVGAALGTGGCSDDEHIPPTPDAPQVADARPPADAPEAADADPADADPEAPDADDRPDAEIIIIL